MNESIRKILDWENTNSTVSLVACKTCFEVALFGNEAKEEKPYNALLRIRKDENTKLLVKKLFDGLLDSKKDLPPNCIRWKRVSDL